MKTFYPSKLVHYFSKEFAFSLMLVFLVFLSLSLLINSVGELIYLKDKKLENMKYRECMPTPLESAIEIRLKGF